VSFNVKLPSNEIHLALLRKFVGLKGEVLKGRAPIKGIGSNGSPPDPWVADRHRLHDLIRGFYKPKGWSYILSILLTEKETNYGQEIKWENYDEGTFKSIFYHAPGRVGDNRSASDISAARRNFADRIPVGLLHNRGPGVNVALGVGYITQETAGVFHIAPASLPDDEIKRTWINASMAVENAIIEGDYSAPDKITTIRARIGQNKFRDLVMSRFGGQCAFCGFNDVDLLIAGHIVRWADDPDQRLNPMNGILLCALCDKAFELGKIKLTADLHIILLSLPGVTITDSRQRWMASLFDRIAIVPANHQLEDLLRRAGKLIE
jgi:hypothetical protein